MTSLFNVKKIVINGNEVNKIAKHYNKNMLVGCKTTTAVTVQALEEAIVANKIECDFEYNKKHETNVSFNELIIKDVKGSTTQALDNAYNLLITKDTSSGLFTYDGSGSLARAEHESIYLASVAKEFNSDTYYTYNDQTASTTVNANATSLSSGSITITLSSASIYKLANGFFGAEEAGMTTTDLEKCYVDMACTTHLTSADYSTPTTGPSISGIAYPNKDIYVKNTAILNLAPANGNSSSGDWQTNYIGTSSAKTMTQYTTTFVKFTALPTTVKEIIVSKDITNFDFELTGTYDLTIKGYAFDLANFGTVDHVKLYVQGTYKDCYLDEGVATTNLNIGATGELHISSNFFDYQDLDNAYDLATAATGKRYLFGDFSGATLGKIVVEKCDLNTEKRTDSDLQDLIQKILNTTATVEFETVFTM